jgi:signal transduction histidine kinase
MQHVNQLRRIAGGSAAEPADLGGAGQDAVAALRRPYLFWSFAVGGAAVAAYSFALRSGSDADRVKVALLEWISVPYLVAGLIAWWRRPGSRIGALMVVSGIAISLSGLSSASTEPLYTIGVTLDILPAAIFLYVYLAFPDGRLRSGFERVLVAAAFVSAVGLQVVKLGLGGGERDNLLRITTSSEIANRIDQAQMLSIGAMCLVGIGLLAAQRRSTGRPLRRPIAFLVDSFAVALLMICAMFVVAVLHQPAFQPMQRATFVAIGISPIVFMAALLSARLARSAVGDLVVELRGDLAPGELRDALARALGDPKLTLAYWLPHFESYADLDGRSHEVPSQDGRSTTLIGRDGAPVAALLHDPALDDEPELLDAVGAAAGIALENARLQAEIAARLEEVKGSRMRVIEAGQKERKRLERDLHDGAQQRLIALSLELRMLQRKLEDNPGARRQLEDAQREITRSLDELRDIARGLHPAVLSAHGLAVALEQVAARATVPVDLTVDVDGRLPEPVEVATYYVVTESLTNVGKHAQATAVSVSVFRAGENVVVEVVDNGLGGANTQRGSGIRGLADRVEALGGRLRVWTPRGGGTRVRAEIPCA